MFVCFSVVALGGYSLYDYIDSDNRENAQSQTSGEQTQKLTELTTENVDLSRTLKKFKESCQKRTVFGKPMPSSVLLQRLGAPPSALWRVSAEEGDAEAFNFAKSLRASLPKLGLDNGDRPNSSGTVSRFQNYRPDFVSVPLKIESTRKDNADPATALKEWLDGIGYHAELVQGSEQNSIVVGPRACDGL